MSTQELILDILGKVDKKIDLLDAKMESKFGKLRCDEQNVRMVVLEQKVNEREESRKESRATILAVVCASIGAFALSVWTWLRGA